MAGPIIVEGPDGQEYEFPSGTSPDVMKQAMRQRYPTPTKPVSVMGSIIPGAQASPAPVSVMGSPITGLPEEELRRRQLLEQAQQAAARQADAERKARVRPVEEAAGVAGRAQLDQGPVGVNPNVYLGAGSEFMLPPDAQRGMQAEREVYRANDVTSSLDAATLRGLNSMAFGLPAMLNKDFRGEIQQAGQDQPGASMAGDIAGYLVPGALVEAGVRGVGRAVQPLVNRFAPTGGSMLERGTRLGGRTVGLGASGATQSGVYQGSVGESVAAAEEGRAPTLAGAAKGLASGATDPFAIFALPAVMGANRLLTYVRSGGTTATPANIAALVDQATGRLLNPRRAIGQTLDMDLAGPDIRPQAMDRIVRELESAGLTTEDIGRLMESVQQRLSSLPESQASRLTFGQALAEATARDRPQALPTILSTLRERRLSGRKGDTSAGIISGVTQDLERSQIDFLSGSIGRNIGDTTLPEVDEQIRLARAAISDQYKQVLAQADPTRPEARGIAMIVAGDASKGVLARRATNAGFESVDAYIAAMPDAAGHWLRSALAKASRKAPEGREKIELQDTVAQLDELLETNEGYRQARMQWGHEAGLEEAQDWAKNFTNIARDEGAVADLLAELNRMPEVQRNVAMSSLRNEILKSVLGGPEDASLRLSKWMTRGALDALEQLGEGGSALADDLRFLGREQRWLFKVDPETLSPTAVRMLSAQTAQQAGNAPMSNMLTGAGQPGALAQDMAISAIAEQALPIMTTQRLLRGVSDAIFRPRTETLQDVSRLYMGRRGNIPTPTEEPNFTPLFNRGTPPAVPPPAGGTPPAPGTPIPPATPPRTVGAGPAAATTTTLPTRTQGASTVLAQSLMGGAGGSALGSRTDLNGDGVIDEQDVFLGSAMGTVGVPAAMRAGRTVGNAGTKNVDPAMLKAAKTEGFNTDRVMYRGMTRPVDEQGFYATVTPGYEAQGLGVSLSTSPKKAGEYGEYVYPIVVRGEFFPENEFIKRINDLYRTEGVGVRDASARVRSELKAQGYAGLKADTGKSKGSLDRGEYRVWGDEDGVSNIKQVGNPQGNTVGRPRGAETRAMGAGGPETPQQAPKALPPPEEGRVRLFNVGTSDRDPGKYLQPHVSDWVNEVASGAGDFDDLSEITKPLIYLSDEPEKWLPMIVGRKIGKHPTEVTLDDIRQHGRLNVVDADPEYDTIYKVGDFSSDQKVTRLDGERVKWWETDLYDSNDFPEMPVGPEPNDFISREAAEISQSLTGDDLVEFMLASGFKNPAAKAPPLKPMGFGASPPKPPQQAARFETPGSPEYEAAVAKGLDMSTPARMARAKDMGFDTETVLYHGTDADVKAFDRGRIGSAQDGKLFGGKGFYFSTKPSDGALYGKTTMPVHVRGEVVDLTDKANIPAMFSDTPLEALGGKTFKQAQAEYDAAAKTLKIDDVKIEADSGFPAYSRVQYKSNGEWKLVGNRGLVSKMELAADPTGMQVVKRAALPVDPRSLSLSEITPDEFTKAAQSRGAAGVKIGGSIGTAGDEVVIFDPSNIRSVNAAFDPDKAASPQLLAGFGKDLLTAGAAGATLGGAMIARDEVLNQPQDARLTSMAVDPARSPQIAPPQAPRPIDTAMRRVGNVANDAAASLYGQSEIRRIENAAARGRAREFETGQQMEQMRPPANASENAVARLYAPPPAEVSMEQADNPLFFGVESFDNLSPNDPLRDPWFRREMIKRSLRDQAYQKAQGRTVGKPKEKRTVGKAGAN